MIGIAVGAFWGILMWLINYIKKFKSNREQKTILEKVKSENRIKNEIEEKKEKLKDLKNNNILSEKEFEKKLEKVNDEELSINLKSNSDYLKLLELYNSGIFDKTEFDEKVKVIKSKINNKRNIINNHYRIVGEFKCGLATAIDNELNYGYVDENQNIIIGFNYEFASDFNNDRALVRLGGKFGFIDTQNKLICEPYFDDAKEFINNKAKVKVKNLWGSININGIYEVEPKYKTNTDF
jgi:hypothetical protein